MVKYMKEHSNLNLIYILAGAGIFAFSALLFWAVLSGEMAARSLQNDPQTALFWRPDDSDALVAQADRLMDEGAFDEAEALGRKAFAHNPLSRTALAQLSLLADWEGHEEQSDTLLTLAAQRSFRDHQIQSRYINLLLKNGAFEKAAYSIDAVLASRYFMDETFLNSVVPLMSIPEPRKYIVERMAKWPSWRSSLYKAISEDLSVDEMILFFEGLNSIPSQPTSYEVGTYVNKLISKDDIDHAYFIWKSYSPNRPSDDAQEPIFTNGDFRKTPDGSPFDWQFLGLKNIYTRIVPDEDADSGFALRISFFGTRVPFQNVVKIIRLQPGNYTLTGRVKSDDLQVTNGLYWEISCLNKYKFPIGKTDTMKGTIKPREFNIDFIIPSDNCKYQELRLYLYAKSVFDQEIMGEIYFYDMNIKKI